MSDNEITKIIENYQYVIEKSTRENYSIHWESFHRERYQDFAKINQIKNFRQSLSKGRDDSQSRLSCLSDDNINQWKNEVGVEFFESCLNEENIGNSLDGRFIDGKYYDYNQLFQIYYAKKIEQNISLKEKIVWEIGGGYGSLAQILMRRKETPKSYIFMDLPEANVQAAYFLKSHFPFCKIGMDIDFPKRKISPADLISYDIIIISPAIGFDREISFELIINTRSMMEMERSVIDKYFSIINSHVASDGALFCVNRYEKNTVGQSIKIADFNFGPFWNVSISEPCYKQPHIHMLLLLRSLQHGDIQKELTRIRSLAEGYVEPRRILFKYQLELAVRKLLGRRIYIAVKNAVSIYRKLFR